MVGRSSEWWGRSSEQWGRSSERWGRSSERWGQICDSGHKIFRATKIQSFQLQSRETVSPSVIMITDEALITGGS